MYRGVGKSGSPAPNPMTGRPAALSALALASTASVADSEIADTRAETLVDMDSLSHVRTVTGTGIIVVDVLLSVCDVPGSPVLTGFPRGGSTSGRFRRRLHGPTAVVSLRQRARDCRAAAGKHSAGDTVSNTHRAVAQLARVPVSKTGGWGFESL